VLLSASNDREIDAAFATLVRERAGALVVSADAYQDCRSLVVATLLRLHERSNSATFAGLSMNLACWMTAALLFGAFAASLAAVEGGRSDRLSDPENRRIGRLPVHRTVQ
jgi:hypothetical protein